MSEPVTFEIDGVDVTYTSHEFGGDTAPHDHFELRSPFVSESGYKSHFEPSLNVSQSGGPFAVARDLISFYWQAPDNQLALPF